MSSVVDITQAVKSAPNSKEGLDIQGVEEENRLNSSDATDKIIAASLSQPPADKDTSLGNTDSQPPADKDTSLGNTDSQPLVGETDTLTGAQGTNTSGFEYFLSQGKTFVPMASAEEGNPLELD